MQSYIGFSDLILIPIYFLILITISNRIKRKNISKNPEFKYLTKGLILKLVGVTLFCLIYLIIYGGGDTTNYFLGTKAMVNLLFQNFKRGIAMIGNLYSVYNNYSFFNSDTGWPPHYMYRDEGTFIVSRITTIFYLLSCGSFIVTSFLTAAFSYIGIWKLFILFKNQFKCDYKYLFYTIVCMPSLLFWGGGIMKDSFVLGACCWATYNFFQIFIARKKIIVNILFIIMNFALLINIKSYVAISLLPGLILWLYSAYLKRITNRALKFIIAPFLIVLFAGISISFVNNLDVIGLSQYQNIDETIEQAKVIQQDLLREEQYGSNNYNIGTLDGSFSGMLKIAPKAIGTAIFRPFIWESGNAIMIFSGIENLILIFTSLYLIITINPIKFFRLIFSEPLLVHCFIFILLFAFGVGIASTNFGALVRYRIPLIPFFYPMLYILSRSLKAT
tara:strand:+ start:451 stop:1788 length:1338 start_codon:yes stop_codon:yes gene_type:complete